MEPPARHQLLQLDGQPPCLINAYPAARGSEARWRCACTITVLMAKKEEQVSLKHTIVNPLSLVPPEISTCVSVLFADLDLCMHLLNVRLQPYSLSGGKPPTGWHGWGVLLPAGRSTKFFRSELSR
ncbi:hypothetical protein T05_1968 [Trichinella murrelli]|uniref:Uncharacterized protein n=1 Tax=Trichinella murrelli TaxID=144512 RepID=A0A0V0T4K2_9BILA|nr:hypothetical protein T05_1968 [Trichinella murrelli]